MNKLPRLTPLTLSTSHFVDFVPVESFNAIVAFEVVVVVVVVVTSETEEFEDELFVIDDFPDAFERLEHFFILPSTETEERSETSVITNVRETILAPAPRGGRKWMREKRETKEKETKSWTLEAERRLCQGSERVVLAFLSTE